MKLAFPITRLRIDGWFLVAAGIATIFLGLGIISFDIENRIWVYMPLIAGGLFIAYGLSMFFFNKLKEYVYDFMFITGLLAMVYLFVIYWQGLIQSQFFPLLISLHVICSLLIRRFRTYFIYALAATIALFTSYFYSEKGSFIDIGFVALWGLMVLIMGYFHLWRQQVGKEKGLHFHLFQEMLNQSSRAMFLIEMERMEVLSINEPGIRLLKETHQSPTVEGKQLLQTLGFHLTYLKKRFVESPDRWEEKSYYKLQGKEQGELELEIVLRKVFTQNQSFLLLRIQDVTGQRAKDRDLERSLTFNKSLVNAIPDMLISLDAQNHIHSLHVPPNLPTQSFSLFKQKPFDAFMGFLAKNEDQQKVSEALEILRKEGGPQELAFEAQIGEEQHFFNLRLVSLGIQGEVLAIFRDVSAQEKNQIALQQSESRYKTLVENMKEGLIMTDTREQILFVNQQMVDMLGDHMEDILGKKSTEIFNGPGNAKEILDRTEQRKKGITDEYELELKLESGEKKQLLIAAAPYLDARDSYKGTIAVITDITDRKLTEKKLEEKKFELDSFMYKASHDLKGPLASIIGVSNIAQTEIDDAAANRYFELITQSAKRLDSILSELIKLTRLNNTRLQLEEIDLEELAGEVVEGLRYLEEAEKMTFNIQIKHGKTFVSDRTLLHSIVQNLIYNSIIYRNKELPTPSVSLISSDYKNGIRVCIRDNGIGIPERIQGRIFEMFYRGNNQSKGSGLGLYIVKTAIEKLDARLELDSHEDIGTEFVLHFPSR